MYNANLHVLYVAKHLPSAPAIARRDEGGDDSERSREADTAHLREFVERYLPHQSKLIFSVREGLPHKEIVDYSIAEDINLIVIATHGRTGLDHLMLGSVAEKVMRFSPVPVLCVKPTDQRDENSEPPTEAVDSLSSLHELSH